MWAITPAMLCLTLLQPGTSQDSPDYANVALFRPTRQSGDFENHASYKVVDGNRDGSLARGTCSHTEFGPGWQWWLVDLEGVYTIGSVRITNRSDCCSSRLRKFFVEVSENDPSTLEGFPGRTNAGVCVEVKDMVPVPYPVFYQCEKAVTGRYVRVLKKSSYIPLALCEVEVFEASHQALAPEIKDKNVALNKPAKQIHTWQNYGPEKAVDGNHEANFFSGSCSHTEEDVDGWLWWLVDLEDVYTIHAIRVTNRLDALPQKLSHFAVEISMEDPATLAGFPERTEAAVCMSSVDAVPIPTPVIYSCGTPITGRYVRLVKNNTGPLTLCEFEVYGTLLSTSEKPIVPREKQNVRFELISQQGSVSARTSFLSKSFIRDCIRQRLGAGKSQELPAYIQVELTTGKCHFLNTFTEGHQSSDKDWVIYKFVAS